MGKREQRTPAEIIAETEAKLSRLRVKAAKKDAESNPQVAALMEELSDVRVTIREAQKGLGDGPQSFNARIHKHNVWIDKIEAAREDAKMDLSAAQARKADLEKDIAVAVQGVITTASTELSAEA